MIKDIASYLGFLSGFIGSAPFAWGLLAEQLDRGEFARGLWYFFGIVTAVGIFAGIAGLGIGMVAGMIWEQFHRYRRQTKTESGGANPVSPISEASGDSTAEPQAEIPRLQLIPPSRPDPKVTGKRIASRRSSSSEGDR